MKTLKFLGCIALIAASVVYAAKTTYFANGISFNDSKANANKGLAPVITNIPGTLVQVVTPADPKSQIVILTIPGTKASLFLKGQAKSIKGKKATGYLDNVGVISDLTQFTLIGTNGEVVLKAGYTMGIADAVQLKGVTVGTVFANGLGTVQADSLVSVYGDTGAKGKGIKIQAVAKSGAFIGGTASNLLGVVKGTLKGIDSKGTMGWLNLTPATPIKTGKTLVKAKVANTLAVYGTAASWKTKNVTIVPLPTAPTGTTFAVTE